MGATVQGDELEAISKVQNVSVEPGVRSSSTAGATRMFGRTARIPARPTRVPVNPVALF